MPELNGTILKNSSNLKAYYRFESGALTTDSSGNGYTLTNNNTVVNGTGMYGSSADLGASNTNKSLSVSSDLGMVGNSARTIVFWLKLKSEISSGTWHFFNQSLYGANWTQARIYYEYNGGTIRTVWGLNFATNFATTLRNGALGTTNWNMIAFTYDQTTVRGYFNGAHIGSVAATPSSTTAGTSQVNVGSIEGVQQASAEYDDLAIFNTALSADQIKELYEGRIYGELGPNQFGTIVGLWHLNGNSTDFSGNNNHGTDTAITYSTANGKFGQGADFNGTSSLISFAPTATTSAVSFGGWLKIDTLGSTRGIMQNYQQNSNPQGWALFLSSTNVISAVVGNNGGLSVPSNYQLLDSAVVSADTWYHVVASYGSSTLKLYINGTEIATGSAPASISNPNVGRIGCRNVSGSNANFFDGKMDELFYTSTALTANQIRQIYAYQKGLLGRYA